MQGLSYNSSVIILARLEKYAFYLFLFAIPFQTRKILWHSNWRFNEWQSISLYGTDLLLMALFAFWLFDRLRAPKLKIKNETSKITIKNLKSKIQNPDFYLILFLIIVGISIKNSSAAQLSLLQWVKLSELILFYFYLKYYALRRFNFEFLARAIIAGGFFQSIIAIAQFYKQSSLGLWLLGESVLSIEIIGVANFLNSTGDKVMRAYGTTPHPNVLAVYLLFVLFIAYYALWKNSAAHSAYYLLHAAHGLILFAFLLTFSRVIIFVWAMAFLIGMITYYGKHRSIVKEIFLTTLVIGSLFAVFYWPEIMGRLTIPADDEGLALRRYYADEAAGSGGNTVNLFGLGIGNFVNWLIHKEPFKPDWFHQPVHNIYLLIYSEAGFLGIFTFLLFLFFSVINFFKISFTDPRLLIMAAFIFIGFFDHFFLTLQQGRLLFWGGLALLTYMNEDAC